MGGFKNFIATLPSPNVLPTPAQGASLVLLDTHLAAIAESTYTFTPSSGLTFSNYSEIEIIISGIVTASLAMEMRLNGDSGGDYYYMGQRTTGSTVANISGAAQNQFVLASSTEFPTTDSFHIKVSFSLNNTTSGNINGNSVSTAGGVVVISEILGLLWNGNTQTISSITVLTSASTWAAGTVISIYGRKRS